MNGENRKFKFGGCIYVTFVLRSCEQYQKLFAISLPHFVAVCSKLKLTRASAGLAFNTTVNGWEKKRQRKIDLNITFGITKNHWEMEMNRKQKIKHCKL